MDFFNPEKSVASFLKLGATDAGGLLQKYEQHRHLTTFLRTHLDPAIAPHCEVGVYDKGQLWIFVDHSMWALPLRYQVPDLTSLFRSQANLRGLVSIQIKVQPKQAASSSESSTPSAPIVELRSQTEQNRQSTTFGIPNRNNLTVKPASFVQHQLPSHVLDSFKILADSVDDPGLKAALNDISNRK